MKRYTALLLVFALLAGAAYYALLSKSDALSSDITAYQKTLYGDPAAAEDLEIVFQTAYEKAHIQWTSTFSGDKLLSTEISHYYYEQNLSFSTQPSETVKDVSFYSVYSDSYYVSNTDESRINSVVQEYGLSYCDPVLRDNEVNDITVSPERKMCFFTKMSTTSSLIEKDGDITAIERKKSSCWEISAFSYAGNETENDAENENYAPELNVIYRLDQGKSMEKIAVNRAQTELLIFTGENGSLYLTRMDLGTMEVLQTLYLFDISDDDAFQWAADLSGGIAVLTDTQLHVFTEENGVYAHALSIEIEKLFADDKIDRTVDFKDYQPLDILKKTRYLSYKNGKLALAFQKDYTNNLADDNTSIFLCTWVFVCDKDALLYCGIYYDTTNLSKDWSSSGYWIPAKIRADWALKPPFRVRWK